MCRGKTKTKNREIQKNYNWSFKDEASGSLLLGVKAMKASAIPVSDKSLLAQALGSCHRYWMALARIWYWHNKGMPWGWSHRITLRKHFFFLQEVQRAGTLALCTLAWLTWWLWRKMEDKQVSEAFPLNTKVRWAFSGCSLLRSLRQET